MLEGKQNLWLVGCGSLPDVIAQLPAASVAMPVLHRNIAVIRDGSAFSTRVQCAALFNRRGLLLR